MFFYSHAMLRKRFHGRRIKHEIQKSTAICTPAPRLNPFRESPGSPTRPTPFFYCQHLPPTSRFLFTYQITKFPLSTNSLATGPSAAAYYSRAPEPEPNTHFEDPNLNVESLRESSDDDRRENGGDRRRTLPEERVLLFTCVSEDGKCCVYLVWTKHNSQELCKEEERTLCIKPVSRYVTEWHDCPLGTLEMLKGIESPKEIESLKWYPKVVNKLEVYPGDMYDVAMEEIMKYGGKVTPLSEKVANKPEVYLGRVANEEATKYGVGVMLRHFLPLRVAMCDQMPLQQKISLIEGSLIGFKNCDLPWIKGAIPSKCSLLWCLCLLQFLDWIQSGIGEKK